MTERIGPIKITTGTIAASGTFTSQPVELVRNEGFFSLQSTLTGSGTAKIQWQESNDGENYNTASTDLYTAQTAGTIKESFAPQLSKFIRILVTETSTTDSVSLVMTLAVQ
jgi:hypothetical protein